MIYFANQPLARLELPRGAHQRRPDVALRLEQERLGGPARGAGQGETRRPYTRRVEHDEVVRLGYAPAEKVMKALAKAHRLKFVSLADIAVGCALGCLDFRIPDLEWRSKHPALVALAARLAQRPSFATTVPRLVEGISIDYTPEKGG